MDAWYSAAKREAFPDSGRFVAGPYRLVLHSTEGGSYAGARAAYLKNKVTPHFTASFEGGRFQVWQHVPLDRASSALEHRAGTCETNRQSAIQIEVVAFAAHPDWPPELVSGVAALILWIRQQCGISTATRQFLPYPASYGKTSVRMDEATWLAFNGVCGHMHVPGQDHGDPGAIPIDALLGPSTTPPKVTPMFSPAIVMEPIVAQLVPANGKGVWLFADSGAVYAWGGAPDKGNLRNSPDFVGRHVATAENLGEGYRILDTAVPTEHYDFP